LFRAKQARPNRPGYLPSPVLRLAAIQGSFGKGRANNFANFRFWHCMEISNFSFYASQKKIRAFCIEIQLTNPARRRIKSMI
jgi:hypothetical protein